MPRYASVLLVLLGLLAPARAQDAPKGDTPPSPQAPAGKDAPKDAPAEAPKTETKPRISLADFEDAFLEVADKVRPGVVAIEVRHAGEDEPRDILFSGVVWDADGTIVALGRDLESASEIVVSPFEGESVKAHFVGADDETGLCILKLVAAPPKGLVALEHGPADKLRAGSFVIAVGNPVGLRHSVAFGHVAATGRSVRRGTFTTKDAIQVTLPVNPGDPGGLLADSRGRLVGVLSSSLRRPDSGGLASFEREIREIQRMIRGQERGQERGNRPEKGEDPEKTLPQRMRRVLEPNVSQLFTQNVSFAIPVDAVAKAVERIRSNPGKPWLGIDVRQIEDDERPDLGLSDDRGVVVSGIREGSPAAKANLRTSDVVLTWNNEAVKSPRALQKLVLSTPVGTSVKLEVVRAKEHLTLQVTVEGRGESSAKPEEKKP
jgi:serine protease Do